MSTLFSKEKKPRFQMYSGKLCQQRAVNSGARLTMDELMRVYAPLIKHKNVNTLIIQ